MLWVSTNNIPLFKSRFKTRQVQPNKLACYLECDDDWRGMSNVD